MPTVRLNRTSIRMKFCTMIVIFIVAMPMIMIIQPWYEIPKIDNYLDNSNASGIVDAVAEPLDDFSTADVDNSSWIELDPLAESGTPAKSEVNDTDSMGMTVVSRIYGFWNRSITLNGSQYNRVEIPGVGQHYDIGQPAVPRLSIVLEIPQSVDVTIEMIGFDVEFLNGFMIAPTQPPSVGIANLPRPQFERDSLTYTTNLFYPNYNISVQGELAASPIDMRGRRLLELNAFPIQFNPMTSRLRLFKQIVFQIKYSQPGYIEPVNQNLYSKAFENVYQNFIVNYQEWPFEYNLTAGYLSSESFRSQLSLYDLGGAEYLIIVNDEFASEARRLADWKTRKGVFTKVVLASDVFHVAPSEIYALDDRISGHQAEMENRIEKLKSYMEVVSQTWQPVPTYVLIFSDVDIIPCDYSIYHQADFTDWSLTPPQNFPIHGTYYNAPESKIPTDVTYFCTRGNDYLPEFIHGRLSADTKDEAIAIVDKILTYERNPPESESYYTNVMMASYYDDFSNENGIVEDRIEDNPFILTAENVTQYLKDVPYIVNRVYASDPDYVVTANHLLYDGQTRVDGLNNIVTWDADTSDVIDGINAGSFLVYHIDHGTSRNFIMWNTWPLIRGPYEGWGNPKFSTEDAAALTNNEEMPVILSMDCSTGWYDGEIDGFFETLWLDMQQVNDDCFAEQMTRLSSGLHNGRQVGGAIAVIAATRTSFTQPSADLTLGITNAIWPGLLNLEEILERPIHPVYNIGTALLRGKLYVNSIYSDPNDRYQMNNATLLLYHVFGDPETPIWTSKPTTLKATHPRLICYDGIERVVVKVLDSNNNLVRNATVCINKNSDIYAVGVTDVFGQVTFDIRPHSRGFMQVTVTKQNCIPYLAQVILLDFCPVWLVLIVGSLAFIILIILDRLGKISLSEMWRRIRDFLFPS